MKQKKNSFLNSLIIIFILLIIIILLGIAFARLAFDGFMSLTDNKKIDIPVYWDWPLETGNTELEIVDNYAIDTGLKGKTMSMQIATTGKQVMEKTYCINVDW